MLYYVKEANSMLRSMNFKKRRKRDKGTRKKKKASPYCLGVHVSDIRVITSPHSSNGFCKIIEHLNFSMLILKTKFPNSIE